VLAAHGAVLGAHGARTIRELILGDTPLADTVVHDMRPDLDVITATPAAFTLDAQLAVARRPRDRLTRLVK
jgi:hypothetical protein